jgi:hypothetical protein
MESRPQALLELEEKLPMVGLFRDVYKDPEQVIAVRLAFVSPQPADRLGLGGYRAEMLLQFEQDVGEEVIGHELAVTEPERQ